MTLDLSSLLKGGVILPRFRAESRKQAIDALAEALGKATGLNPRDISDAVMQRERLGSTGVGEGVAIPHARLPGLSAPVGGVMLLNEGVDFEAVDERPCDIIFMLLAPMNSGADHLRALAQVSRALRNPDIREKLRWADSGKAVQAILCPESVTGQVA